MATETKEMTPQKRLEVAYSGIAEALYWLNGGDADAAKLALEDWTGFMEKEVGAPHSPLVERVVELEEMARSAAKRLRAVGADEVHHASVNTRLSIASELEAPLSTQPKED